MAFIMLFAIIFSCLFFPGVRGDRAYPLGCSDKPLSYYNYDNYPFPPPATNIRSTDDFLLVRRLGAGKFSDVFEAVDVNLENKYDSDRQRINPKTLVVLKCLKPVSERKIKRELLVLSHASQLPNLARLLGVVVPKSLPSSPTTLQPMPSLVLRHAGRESQWLCHGTTTPSGDSKSKSNNSKKDAYLSDYDVRYYLCHLLVALDALHSKGMLLIKTLQTSVTIYVSF